MEKGIHSSSGNLVKPRQVVGRNHANEHNRGELLNLPASPDIEQAVIGVCLTWPTECVAKAQEAIVTEEIYSDFRNRVIWNAITELTPDKGDVVMVRTRLKAAGWLDKIGGDEYLNRCQDKGIGPSFLQMWLDELMQQHTLRKLILACDEIKQAAVRSGAEVHKVLDMAEGQLAKLRPQQKRGASITTLVSHALDKFSHKYLIGGSITGLSTGLIDLDRTTDGMHTGEMIVVAAFPSCGKSALALNVCVHNAIIGMPTLILTAEMTDVQQVVRALCATAGVNFHKLTEHSIPKIGSVAPRLSKAPLFVEQVSGTTIGQLTAIARRVNAKTPIKLIMVDYLQLIQGTGDNREQQVADVAQGCKHMAMELDCPVLALSQLTDEGKLRESRAIGQHADTIWKLRNKGEWQPVIQPVEVLIEKCREGATGTVELIFEKCYTRFVNAPKTDCGD